MQGGSVVASDFDLVLRSTIGCAPLPELNQIRMQLMDAGFRDVKTAKLTPFEPYYGIVAR